MLTFYGRIDRLCISILHTKEIGQRPSWKVTDGSFVCLAIQVLMLGVRHGIL